MGVEVLFLLLPVAAFSGWFIGRNNSRPKQGSTGSPLLSRELFQGLNFILNEQPDEALEVFIRMSQQDNETVDIQFALASLFLRRGEVDRAIRIHQNLIARPLLSRSQRNQALYELALDYMRAGLLDRAESLFQDLLNDPDYGVPSKLQLLDIFQQEKEWQQAIEVARNISSVKGSSVAPMIAHYFCELAESALKRGDSTEAKKLIKRAFKEDRNCVRASLLDADIALGNSQLDYAIRAYKKIEQQDADYLPLAIEPLQKSYELQGQLVQFVRYLRGLVDKRESISLVLALAQQLHGRGEEQQALELLKNYLQRRPSLRALDYLLELRVNHGESAQQGEAGIVRDIVRKLLSVKPVNRCNNCGFSSKSMHWQCPSCKRWNTVKPIHGIEGE